MKRSARQLGLAVVLALVAMSTSSTARADESSLAAATVLFDEGVKLMDAGRYAEACPKLARSQVLAPSGGTLLALAECSEKTGKIASAWVAYREAATRAGAAGRRDAETFALEHAKSLEARLPRLTVSMPDARTTPGLEVKRDGVPLKDAELGVAVPVDPGPHEIVATAQGRRKWLHTVAVREGASVEVAIPALEPDDGTTPFKTRDEESGWHAQKSVGLVVGGLGIASVIVGAVFGAKASSTNDEALANCPVKEPTVRCNSAGLALTEDAKGQALASTVSVIVGAAAMIGGGVLFFTAPSGAPRAGNSSGPGPGPRLGVAPFVGREAVGAAAALRW
ncbi:MAG: hypothetical protein JST00_03680 [Deltaproteobacteria bacterium]|nr:hypothetical protein [Deltaproteobacteria bacterium]